MVIKRHSASPEHPIIHQGGLIFCILFLGLIILSCLCTGCSLFGGGSDPESIVCAQVNGKKITLEDFNQELQRFSLDSEEPYLESEDQIRSLKKELLLAMIDKELIVQEANARGIKISPGDLEVSMKDAGKGYPSGRFSTDAYMTDPSYEGLRSFFMEGLLVKRLLEREIEPSLTVSEEEVRSFFLTHKQEFEKDREYRARQIVVESEIDAREILGLLQAGHDFAKLAQERSLSPDHEMGGDLGFFSLGQMPPEFDEAVTRLKIGEISDVIQSDYGYHLFQLLEIREGKDVTWEDVQVKIRQILLAQKREEAFHDWLLNVRSHARIKVNLKALSEDLS